MTSSNNPLHVIELHYRKSSIEPLVGGGGGGGGGVNRDGGLINLETHKAWGVLLQTLVSLRVFGKESHHILLFGYR